MDAKSTVNKNVTDVNSFFDDDTNSGFKFKDVVFLVLRNLHWFIIFALIGGAIAYYKVKTQERIYASRASLLIKTSASGGSESFRGSAPINKITGAGLVISTVNNEMMVLRSQRNMENMVRALNLNITYAYKTKVSKRNKNLYKSSPVEVRYLDLDEQSSASFSVTPIDKKYALLDDLGTGIPSMRVALNDTIAAPCGRIVISPTWRYEDFINIAVVVRHVPLSAMASTYRSSVRIARDNDRNAILRLSLQDTSPFRAADVLNTLMDVYNQESIDDQQRVLDYTEKFINDRIDYLMTDIKEYEQVNVSFKQTHNIIDTRSFGQDYLRTSVSSTEEEKKLIAQVDMIRYLVSFVEENEDKIIPVGLTTISAEASSAIKQYNENLLKIEKYKADGIENNPVAQNLMDQQVTLRSSIISLLEGYMIALQERITAANREKIVANSQIHTVPVAQLELSSLERMQGIKEKLYLQLLTKREELLMTSPQLEATAKVIDYAAPINVPIAPNEGRMILIGVLIGLAIPILFMVLRNMLDTTIHDRIDVQKSSNVPFLGDIPYRKGVPGHSIMVRENG